MKRLHIGARLFFCLLALDTLIHDFLMLSHGFPHLKGWQRCHLPAMVLAFSPNTVSALSAALLTEVKVYWLKDLPLRSDKLGWACDALAIGYANGLGLLYNLPFFVILFLYGIVGAFTMGFCFCRDALSLLPWRFFGHKHVDEIWIALPILFALAVRSIVNIGLIIGHESIVKKRYPEEAASINPEDRINMMQVQMPEQVSASVIGLARSVAGASSASSAASNAAREVRGAMGLNGGAQDTPSEEPLVELFDGRVPPTPHRAEPNSSILNHSLLAWLCYVRTSLVVSIPILQIFVISAVRVYLGTALWQAGLETFKERTWSHYFKNVWDEGFFGGLRLLWIFL